MKGLVVDDDPGVRRLMCRLIEQDFPVETVEAADGLRALDILLHENIAFVLLDVGMPTLSGIDTLRFIRRSPHLAFLPVAILTGKPDEELVRQSIELGAIEFIAKPILPATFRDRIAPVIASAAKSGAGPSGASVSIAPTHRILFVDRSAECRLVAYQILSRLCHVDLADNEFAAWAQCLDRTPDLLVVGATSDLSTVYEFTQRVRDHRALRALRVVAVVASDELGAARESGMFHAVIVRSFFAEAFERGLFEQATADTRTRLYVHHDSSWLQQTVAAVVCTALTEVLHADVSVHAGRVGAIPSRWVAGAVELQGGAVAWSLRFDCPFETALHLASLARQGESDEVTESEAVTAVAAAIRHLAHRIQREAVQTGLPCQVTESRPTVRTAPSAESRARPIAASWRLVTGGLDVGTVSVVPLWAGVERPAGASVRTDQGEVTGAPVWG